MKLRYTEASFANARKEAQDRREKIEQMEAWLSSFDKNFWQGVVVRVNGRLESLQLERDSQLNTMSEAALRANLACDKELRYFLTLPNRAAEGLETMKKGYQEIMEFVNANRDKAE